MPAKAKPEFHLGTSGLIVPGNRLSRDADLQHMSRLQFYSTIFNSLEVNSIFYKLPQGKTLERWSAEVGKDFTFTLKFSKQVTHSKMLEFDPKDIEAFFTVAGYLPEKNRACLLIQFPGSISSGFQNKVQEILQAIEKFDPGNTWKKALEFRHASWYRQGVYDMLAKFNAALVLHDSAKGRHTEPGFDMPFIYLRLHGPEGNYRGEYEREYLDYLAEQVDGFLAERKQVYCYFNNTMGKVFENVMMLKDLLEAKR